VKELHQNQPDPDQRAPAKDASQRSGCAGVFLMVWGFGWLAGGCLFLNFAFLVPLYRSATAINWHPTPCTITSSGVDRRDVRIAYDYDFDGREYESDRYDFNESGTRTERRMKAVRDRYPAGKQVTCYVNPNNPTQAAINRGFNPSILLGFIALIVVNIGLFAMGVGWRWLRGKKKLEIPSALSVPSRSLSRSHHEPAGVTIAVFPPGLVRGFGGWFSVLINASWILVIIPLAIVVLYAALTGNLLVDQGLWSLLILIPFVLVILCTWSALNTARQRTELTAREGVLTVRQAGLFRTQEQQWAAQDLAHVRVTPYGVSSQSQNDERTDGPWQASLEIVSNDGSSYSFLNHRDESELEWIAAQLRNELSLGQRETGNWLPKPQAYSEPNGGSDGPVTLCPDASGVGQFVGNSLFALIWYGILAAAGQDVVKDLLQGLADWNAAIWLLFVLFGLVFVRRAGYSFLGLFSPQPTITVSTASLSLGDSVELTWSFTRNPGLLTSLEIYLWGEERARVQCRGRRRTRVATETFAELPIIKSRSSLRSGKVQMTIPENSMHSFEAEHGGIDWSVQVFADVSLLPNVAVGFPITVLPKRIESKIADNEPAED
jgi:hypothetical protein